MKTGLYFILLLFLVNMQGLAHPVHLSVTNLDFIPDSNKIKFSLKTYSDDFSEIINYKYNTFLSFGERVRITTKEQNAIAEYINQNFRIIVNSDTLVNRFVTLKVEEGSVWLSFCTKIPPNVNSFQVLNTYMLDFFNDQTNLVISRKGDVEIGKAFNKRNTLQSFEFE